MRNSVRLIGYIGNELKFMEFTGGSKKAQCTLATTTSYKSASGELVRETQWHNIIAWGSLAENMKKLISKGSQILVEGSITYRNYKDAAGVERYITEIKADNFLMLDKSKASESIQDSGKKELAGAPLDF
ncbi:MAG: single-stranded DNA-binding protein [Saprospiraceae bacterium]|nr:single-stranded DNA-binding protein [Saprospiraceae bacterium]